MQPLAMYLEQAFAGMQPRLPQKLGAAAQQVFETLFRVRTETDQTEAHQKPQTLKVWLVPAAVADQRVVS